MKNFIFRKSNTGFFDWIGTIYCIRRATQSNLRTSERDKEAFTESGYWYQNYLTYLKRLTENQKEFLKIYSSGHIPPYDLCSGFEIRYMYEKWLEIVGNFKLNHLEEIRNEEVGAAIKKAREYKCRSRKEVAELIGIGQDTLKAYETGKRTLPFDVYYKLIRLFDLNIGIMNVE